MKKILFSVFAAVMAIGFVGCEYDDSEIVGRVENLEQRVLTLEQLCQQMNTNITAMQAIINALQTQDYITAVTPITQGSKTVGYTITFAKGDPITIYHGQDGKDGADGEDGKDGYTPVIGVDQDEDGKYYWTLDGEWMTDKEGNKIPATGKDGQDGKDGADGKDGENGKDGADGKDGENGKDGADGKDGKDGITPQLDIRGGYWYISYDNGVSWERLGRATGYDGTDGKDGVDGDAFFDNVVVNEQKGYVTFYFTDGTAPIEIPLYKAFKVEIISTSATYVKVGDTTDVSIKYSITGCTNPTVLVISDLEAKASNGVITVKAPDARGDLEATETVTLMVSNGSTTVMASVDITVADVVIADATNSNAQTELNAALQNSSVSTIALKSGTYIINPYNAQQTTLTIIGNGSTEVQFNPGGSNSIGLNEFDQFTIKNCEILKMGNKWGMLTCGTGKANGVYTVDNCTFNGVGTQGIYINQQPDGAVYNITNCTFNGDFGGEGAVTIQQKNDNSSNYTVNVKGCKFNNIPDTSHKICILYNETDFTPNTDVAQSDIYRKN